MKLNSLIDFLPYEYKDQDTYKVDGKGILERYLQIFGDYFQDIITEDTRSVLDIIDIDNTPGYYLNYLWEFLGELPYANTPIISEDTWKLYFSGFKDKETMNKLCDEWLNYRTGILEFDTDTVRKLLKCSVALFKIRGTKQFFEVLFRLYGLGLEITDPVDDNTDLWIPDNHPQYDFEDQTYDSDVTYDNLYRCTQCVDVPIKVTGHGFTSPTPEAISFRNSILALFRRFLPYFANPVIDFDTVTFRYRYSITAQVDRGSTLIPGEVDQIPILVIVTEENGYPNPDLRYQVSGDNIHWSNVKYDSPSTYIAKRAGYLYFRSVGDPTQIAIINIKSQVYIKSYNLYGTFKGTSLVNGNTYDMPTIQEGGDGTIKVTMFGTMSYKGETYNNIGIRLVNTGEIKESGNEWTLSEAGTYTWELVNFPTRKFTITVRKEDSFEISCNPVSAVWDEDNPPSTVVTVVSKYTPNPPVAMVDVVEPLGESPYTYTASGIGTVIFYCPLDPENKRAFFTVSNTYIKPINPTALSWRNVENPTLVEEDTPVNITATLRVSFNITNTEYNQNSTYYDDIIRMSRIRVYKDGELFTTVTPGSVARGTNNIYSEAQLIINTPGKFTAEYSLGGTTSLSGTYTVTQIKNLDYALMIVPQDTGGWDSTEAHVEHTFKFSQANSRMRFTLECEGLSSKGTAICSETGESFEVNTNTVYTYTKDQIKQGTYTFVLQGVSENNDSVATLIVQKDPPKYSIECTPVEATMGSDETSISTTVVVTMDPIDTSGEFSYDILVDGGITPYSAEAPGYVFTTRSPGIHTFVVKDDPNVSCTFTVNTNNFISPDELVWGGSDTTEKEVTITTNVTNTWTVELTDSAS